MTARERRVQRKLRAGGGDGSSTQPVDTAAEIDGSMADTDGKTASGSKRKGKKAGVDQQLSQVRRLCITRRPFVCQMFSDERCTAVG